MTTAVIKEKEGNGIRDLIKSMIRSHSSLGVVRFFATHPKGKFSQLAIVHAMDETDSHREIKSALAELAAAGVLKMITEHRICFYRLTTEEPVRGIVMRTAEMDWRRWQLILE